MMSNYQLITDDSFGTSNDYEVSQSGDEGKEYQRKVLALQLCLAHQNFTDYKLATEVKRAGVFDDLVLECENASEKKISFVQIKNKKIDESKDKKDLTAHNLMRDENFDLQKYFLAFLEISFDKEYQKFDKKIMSIYTNVGLSLKRDSQGIKINCSEFRDEWNNLIEIHFDKIELDESLITHRSGEIFKISTESKNEKFLKYFVDKVGGTKLIGKLKEDSKRNQKYLKSVETGKEKLKKFQLIETELEAKVKVFFENLLLSTSQPEIDEIDSEVDQFCLKFFSDSIVIPELENFFRPVGLKAKKIKKEFFDNFLSDKEIGRQLERLIGVTKEFLDSIKSIRFNQNFVDMFQTNEKISILKTPKDLRHLGLKVLSQNFEQKDIEDGKILITKSSNFKSQNEKFLNCMKLKKIELLLIEIDEENFTKTEGFETKVIFVCDYDFQYEGCSIKLLSEFDKLIQCFHEDFEKELFSYEFNFQGKLVKFSEVFYSSLDFIESVNDVTLAKILNNKLSIGEEIKNLSFNENYYVERIYDQELFKTTEIKHNIKADDLIQRLFEYKHSELLLKPILIHNVAGMGKSTEIIMLGMKIKEIRKDFWVLKIELGSEKFVKVLDDWNKEDFLDLLQYFVEGIFETLVLRELYSYGKVAVLLDGFDEIPSQKSPKTLEFLFEKILYESLRNIFVITSRTSVIEEFSKLRKDVSDDAFDLIDMITTQHENDEGLIIYHMKYFDNDQQIKFVNDWIIKNLEVEVDKTELLSFCTNLILTMSQTLHEGSNFLGVPLQVRMLAEIFCQKIKDEGKFPQIPENISLTNLFRIFFDNKYKILHSKEQISAEIFVKLCKGKIKVEETLLKFSIHLLNPYWRRSQMEIFDPSEEVKNLMIHVGLMNFNNSEATFIHRAFPEFLVAEKFFEIINESDENKIQEIVASNQEVFETVLLHGHQMILTFVEEFLKLNGKPKFAIKVIKTFCTLSVHHLFGTLQNTFRQSTCEFFLLMLECALRQDLVELDGIFLTISYEKVSDKIMKIFPQILKIVLENFHEIKPKKSEEYRPDFYDVVSCIISKIFNASTLDDSQEALELVKNWKVMKKIKNRQKLLKSRLKSFQVTPKSEENFLKFFKEFDENLFQTLVNCHESRIPYVFYIDLLGLKEDLKFIENWAIKKDLNFDKETENQLKLHKNQILEFFIRCFPSWELENLHNSKFLNPKVLIELLMQDVNNFEDYNFPFLFKLDSLDESVEKKFLKMEELFRRNYEKDYEELFKCWMKKVSKFCKLWNECHVQNYDFKNGNHLRSIPQNFIGGSLLVFIKLNKISIKKEALKFPFSLSVETCKFLNDFLNTNFYFSYDKEQNFRARYLDELTTSIQANTKQKVFKTHNCNFCFICKKNQFKSC